MSSYRSVAASVARAKEAHPEQFCPHPKCLWRTGGGRCPRHPGPAASLPDPHAACGPCADARNLVLTSGFPAAACKFCGGPTGRRLYSAEVR